jgi:hypothetical protein
MRDLDLLSENLKARTAEIGMQIDQSTASQGTTSELVAKITELKARAYRCAAMMSGAATAESTSSFDGERLHEPAG